MGFSTQTLLWAISAGIVTSWVVRPRWSNERIGWRACALAPVLVITAVWMATNDFFGAAHIGYLLATVVPGCVLLASLLSADGRRWRRSRRGIALGVLLAAPVGVGLYASHIEPEWLRVDEVEIVNGAGDLRIGVLADLQTPTIGSYERDAVERLIEADPDLVVIAGDLWQTTDDAIVDDWPQFAVVVQDLVDAVEHVVIVEGDTDHIGWLDPIGRETGAEVAFNRVVRLEIEGVDVVVGGTQLLLDDVPPSTADMLDEVVAAESDDTLTIVLAHRPDVVDVLPGRVDLVIAGHTHGGQVQIPFVGPLITHSDVPREVAAGGLHEVDGQAIYVSTGVGRERGRAPQVRFNARPSIGVIDVVAGPT